jgi:hypothetical protein
VEEEGVRRRPVKWRHRACSGFAFIVLVVVSTVPSVADVYTFAPRKVHSVCGRVTDGTAAIAGASVQLQSADQKQTVSETKSDSDGRYKFPRVSKGKYWIQIDSFVGKGAAFILLTKTNEKNCSELILTKIVPGKQPEDGNNTVIKVQETKN